MTWRNQESGSEGFFGIGFGTGSLGIDDVAESGIGRRSVFGRGFGMRSRGDKISKVKRITVVELKKE